LPRRSCRSSLAVALLLVSGFGGLACSQVTGPLTGPSIGDNYTQGMRSAFQDVIFSQGLTLRSGPECTPSSDDTGMDCVGTLVDGPSAAATARGGDDNDLVSAKLSVSIGGRSVYEGSIEDVLTAEDTGGAGG